MKYSIERLEKIREIAEGKLKKADEVTNRVFFNTSVNPWWDDPEYIEHHRIAEILQPVIKKIDELFEAAVTDFINEEIELD